MNHAKRKKLVICSEYQGEGALQGTVTGFQIAVTELINRAGMENEFDVALYCMGTKDRESQHPLFSNVTIKQYKPNLSLRWLVPFVPEEMLPYLVDVFPLHLSMIKEIIAEKPDVIHTFQTFGATDIAGYIAAKILKKRGATVRLVCTVMTEVDTYFIDYFRLWVSNLYDQMEKKALSTILRESAKTVIEGRCTISKKKLILHTFPVAFWYLLQKVSDWIQRISDFWGIRKETQNWRD